MIPFKTLQNVAQNLYRDSESGFYFGMKIIAGAKKRKSFGTNDRAEANRKLAKWLLSLEATDQGAATLKFEALIDRFMTTRKSAGRTKGNYASIANKLKNTFQRGRAIAVRAIKTSDLMSWLNAEADRGDWSGS